MYATAVVGAILLAVAAYSLLTGGQQSGEPKADVDSKKGLAGQQFADSREGLVLSDASGASDEFTPTERLVARVVYAEAADRPELEKRAVASVIRNRVVSKQFPNTYEEVIFKKNEFKGVGNRLWVEHFNAAGEFISPRLADRLAYQEALRVAAAVVRGVAPDPTGGALYFHSYPNREGIGWFREALASGRIRPSNPERIGVFWLFR